MVVAFLADYKKWRGPFILICLPVTIAGILSSYMDISRRLNLILGYILAIKAETNDARYAAVFLMAAGVYVLTSGRLPSDLTVFLEVTHLAHVFYPSCPIIPADITRRQRQRNRVNYLVICID